MSVFLKCYKPILCASTNEEALEFARGFVWGEEETSEQTVSHVQHVDTVNFVGVWHCYGADHYFFTDESGGSNDGA